MSLLKALLERLTRRQALALGFSLRALRAARRRARNRAQVAAVLDGVRAAAGLV